MRDKNGVDVDIRPWGWYEVILDHPQTKVKLITVKPNSRLSYQYHHKRQEQWTVVSGNLTIVLDDEKVFRAWNETKKEVRFIEVQTGTYFGEDDIIRIEDDFNRI